MIISDKVYVMNNGIIEQSGKPKEIYNNPKTSFIARFIGNYNVLSKDVFEKHFKKNINTKEVAIRPEVIQITKEELGNDVEYNLKDCEVTDVSIIGNVIRYETRKDNLTMNIDVINNDIYDTRYKIRR